MAAIMGLTDTWMQTAKSWYKYGRFAVAYHYRSIYDRLQLGHEKSAWLYLANRRNHVVPWYQC